MLIKNFSSRLLAWHQSNGRHDLPWQNPITPYRVWVSEIMLQQTQVKTVIPYFERFMQRFGTLGELACASQEEVLQYWAGLGYYSRARNLHRCAQLVQQEFNGQLPVSVNELINLPGIGRSTAGAIAAIAYQKRAAILDGNVKRVLTRLHGITGYPEQPIIKNQLWEIAEQYCPDRDLPAYTQAQMDLGATLCTRSKPKCDQCPFNNDCYAFQHDCTTELPSKKPQRKLSTRRTRVLIIQSTEQLLLEKRPQQGIWGGLWSLPEIAINTSLSQWLQKNSCQLSKEIIKLEKIKHSFTHYHLEIFPVVLSLLNQDDLQIQAKNWQWHQRGQVRHLALPTPIKKLLEA